MKVSKSGYKRNSKDKNQPALVIPSNNITMRGVDFPVYGIDNTGYGQMMYPGVDNYYYPGDYVFELPMAQVGMEMPFGLPLRSHNPSSPWAYESPMANGYILPDLNRPELLNTGATEYKMGVDDVMIPTIVDGNYMSPDDAYIRYMLFGEQFKPMLNPRAYSEFYNMTEPLGLMRYDDGGQPNKKATVAEIWKQTTGLPWSEAKKQGLTDGSYSKNIELRKKLIQGEFGDVKYPVKQEQTKLTKATPVSNKRTEPVEEKQPVRKLIVPRTFGTPGGLKTDFQIGLRPDKPLEGPWGPKIQDTGFGDLIPMSGYKAERDNTAVNVNVPRNIETAPRYAYDVPQPEQEVTPPVVRAKRQTPLIPLDPMMDFGSFPMMPDALRVGNLPSNNPLTNLNIPNSDPYAGSNLPLQFWTDDVYQGKITELKPGYTNYYKLDNVPWWERLYDWASEKVQYVSDLMPQVQYKLEEHGVVAPKTDGELIEIETPKIDVEKQVEEKNYFIAPQVHKVDNDADYSRPNTKFWGYRYQNKNDDGLVYKPTPRREKLSADTKFEGVQGVAHFLIRTDLTDGYMNAETRDQMNRDMDHGRYVPFYIKEGKNVRVKYGKGKDEYNKLMSQGYEPMTTVRTLKYDDIAWDKSARPYHSVADAVADGYSRTGEKGKMFGEGILNLVTKDATPKDTWLIYKEATGKDKKLGRHNGNSIVFAIETKDGRIIRDFSGTVADIQKEADQIIKDYNIDTKDLSLLFYDAGSYSAKPKADDKGVVSFKSYNTFNTIDQEGGAALMIPLEGYKKGGTVKKMKYGGDPSIPDLSNRGWLDKYQVGGPKDFSETLDVNQPYLYTSMNSKFGNIDFGAGPASLASVPENVRFYQEGPSLRYVIQTGGDDKKPTYSTLDVNDLETRLNDPIFFESPELRNQAILQLYNQGYPLSIVDNTMVKDNMSAAQKRELSKFNPENTDANILNNVGYLQAFMNMLPPDRGGAGGRGNNNVLNNPALAGLKMTKRDVITRKGNTETPIIQNETGCVGKDCKNAHWSNFQCGGVKKKLQEGGIRKPRIVNNPESDRSYYDPISETITMGVLPYGVNPNYVKEHENFHHLQNMHGALHYGTPVKRATIPSADEFAADYYNRKGLEIQDLTDEFKYYNPEFGFVPDDLIYNKYVDYEQYDRPYTVEGEAQDYENYIRSGGKSIFRKNGGSLDKYQFLGEVNPEPRPIELLLPEFHNLISGKTKVGLMDFNTLLHRQAFKESSFRDDVVKGRTKSNAGAIGLGQFMPGTITELKRLKLVNDNFDPLDPKQSAEAQRKYMEHLWTKPYLAKGTELVQLAKILGAYNVGPGAMKEVLTKAKEANIDIYNDETLPWLSLLSPETKDYIEKVLLKKNTEFEDAYNKNKKTFAELYFPQTKTQTKKYGGILKKYQGATDTGEVIYKGSDLPEAVVSDKPSWLIDRESKKPDDINWYETFNYKKWGLNDYSDFSSFNSAFRNARESGEKEFVWKDKRFTTDLAPKEVSDKYWRAKKFLQDYYTNEPFIKPDTTEKWDAWNNYTRKKFGTTWNDYYDKIVDDPGYINPEQDNYQRYWGINDTLDMLSWPMTWKDLPDEAKEMHLEASKKPYIEALNDLDYYFSITSQRDPASNTLGYQQGDPKRLFISDAGDIKHGSTTAAHELSHKGDSNSRLRYYDTTLTHIPKVNIDLLNKYGTNFSQEDFDYVSTPTETEARKMATLFWMKDKLGKDVSSGKITKDDLDMFMNLYINDDPSLPDDVGELLELYKWQTDDLLKYLNNDFSYTPSKKYGGGLDKYQGKKESGEVLTYKSNPEYFDNRAVYHDNSKYNDLIRKSVYAGTHGFNPKTGELVKLNKSVSVPAAVRERSTEAWGKKSYQERFKSDTPAGEEVRKDYVKQSMDEVVRNPIFYAPGIIGGGALLASAAPAIGAGAATVFNAPMTIGSTVIPGATIGNAIGALGASAATQQFLDPNSMTRQSYGTASDNPTLGNIMSAVGNTALTASDYLGLGIGKAGLYGTNQLGKFVRGRRIVDSPFSSNPANSLGSVIDDTPIQLPGSGSVAKSILDNPAELEAIRNNINLSNNDIVKLEKYLDEVYDYNNLTPFQKKKILDRETYYLNKNNVSVDQRIQNNKNLLTQWENYKNDRIEYFNSPKFRERVNKQYGEMSDEIFKDFKEGLLQNLEKRPYIRPDVVSEDAAAHYKQEPTHKIGVDDHKYGHTYYKDEYASDPTVVFHEGRHQLTNAEDEFFFFPSRKEIEEGLIHPDLLKVDYDLTNPKTGADYFLSPEEFITRLDELKRDMSKVGYDYKTMDLTPEILKQYKGLTPKEAISQVTGKSYGVKMSELTPEQQEAVIQLLDSSPDKTKDSRRLLNWFKDDFLLNQINNKWGLVPYLGTGYLGYKGLQENEQTQNLQKYGGGLDKYQSKGQVNATENFIPVSREWYKDPQTGIMRNQYFESKGYNPETGKYQYPMAYDPNTDESLIRVDLPTAEVIAEAPGKNLVRDIRNTGQGILEFSGELSGVSPMGRTVDRLKNDPRQLGLDIKDTFADAAYMFFNSPNERAKYNGLNPWTDRQLGSGLDATLDATVAGLSFAPALSYGAKAGLQGAGRLGRFITTQTPVRNAYKINPWAFKPNEANWYRQVGKSAIDDALETGIIREAGEEVSPRMYQEFQDQLVRMQGSGMDAALASRRPASPFFGKGELFYPMGRKPVINKTTGKLSKNPAGAGSADYLIETSLPNESFQPAYVKGMGLGVPTEVGSTAILKPDPSLRNLENFNIYKQDWLRGYKQVPKPKTLPRSKTSYSIVRDSEGKIQFLDNETYRDALVTGKSNIVNYLSDPRYKAVVEGNQELANRLNMNRVLPIQKEMGNAGLHDARVAKINQPITILDPRSLETKIIQGTNEGVQAQYSRNLDGSGFLTIPRVYDKTKTIKNVEHEALHHVYPNLGEGLPSFTPLEARKAKAVFKDNAALRKIEEENNIPFWYLDDVDELVPNSFDLANDLGIAKFQKYPGVESFKKMLESYTGGKKFIKDALKLDTPRDYKRAWDMLSGVRLGLVGAGAYTLPQVIDAVPEQKYGGWLDRYQ